MCEPDTSSSNIIKVEYHPEEFECILGVESSYDPPREGESYISRSNEQNTTDDCIERPTENLEVQTFCEQETVQFPPSAPLYDHSQSDELHEELLEPEEIKCDPIEILQNDSELTESQDQQLKNNEKFGNAEELQRNQQFVKLADKTKKKRRYGVYRLTGPKKRIRVPIKSQNVKPEKPITLQPIPVVRRTKQQMRRSRPKSPKSLRPEQMRRSRPKPPKSLCPDIPLICETCGKKLDNEKYFKLHTDYHIYKGAPVPTTVKKGKRISTK